MQLHSDFIDFIQELINNNVEFVIIGAHALGFYGLPRATGDFDFWIRQTKENSVNILRAVEKYFGTKMGLTENDIFDDDTIQFGVQPVRIDLLKKISGVTNEEIWNTKVSGKFAGFDLYFINKDALIKNKKAAGRHKDIADVNILIESDKSRQ